MKRFAAIAVLCVLARVAWGFMAFALGPTWNANEVDLLPLGTKDPDLPNLIILGTQLSTGQNQPSVRSFEQWVEPASLGVAFEFQISDGGAFFWNTETNSIFVVQNGQASTQGWQSDVYGNLGPFQGTPDNNRLLLDYFENFTPATGFFHINAVPSFGWIEISDLVYSYSTDGTNGGGSTFTFSIDRGGSICSFELPCSAGSTTTAFIDETRFGTCTLGGGFSQLEFDFGSVGNCAVAPVVRLLQVHHVFTTAAP